MSSKQLDLRKEGDRPRIRLNALSPFHRTKLAFLAAAFAALVLSVVVWTFVDREQGLFIGLWVPGIHSLGALVLVGEEGRRE